MAERIQTSGGGANMKDLGRIRAILDNEQFQTALRQLEELERDRIYCKHGLSHLLDTARIAALMAVDSGADYPRDVIYAAALLHDIGRIEQYTNGIPHAQAGVPMAKEILQHTAFTPEECEEILQAVGGHRTDCAAHELTRLLGEADHRSRMCFACAAQATCKWAPEKRNHTVLY
jgi:putative nucleotidyltransferase with HDIG domain